MKTRIILPVLLTFLVVVAHAHAIWIETPDQGAIGKSQEVKIFYGEYAAQEFEETTTWYSDVSTFVLWLTLPDGSKTQLTCKPGNNH